MAHLRSIHRSAQVGDQVADALHAVRGLVQALSRSASTVERKTGVTNAQLFLLQQIRAHRNLTVNDLAARAMTTQSTVSIVLSRLERRGLVERARSPHDARSVVLGLTPSGRRLLRRAPAPATSEILDALRRLTRNELHALSRGLSALRRELGSRDEEPEMLFEHEAPGAAARGRRGTADRSSRNASRAPA